MATTSKSTPRGRPRAQQHGTEDTQELFARIDSCTPGEKHFSKYSSSTLQPLFSVAIPNRLLQEWHRRKEDGGATYVALLNGSIKGGVAGIKSGCSRVEHCLRKQAGKVALGAKRASGRSREQLLQGEYHVFICEEEAENIVKMQEGREFAQELADSWKEQCQEREEEISTLLEDMAECISQYEEKCELEERDHNLENQGKKLDEVSSRQARRKLETFTKNARDALWFAESFGLIPECLSLKKSSGSPLRIPLADRTNHPTLMQSSTAPLSDYHKVMQILFVLDHFAVSDEAYHEFSVSSHDLPPLYKVKQARLHLNKAMTINRLPPPHLGAYRPFHALLSKEISKIIDTSQPQTITIKLSGDGARFSKSSNIILLSFSFPGHQSDVLSATGITVNTVSTHAGNHSFAAIRGDESYDTLKNALKVVMDSINELLRTRVIVINGITHNLEFVLGSDYKFLLLMLGLNQAHSAYACVWCDVHKDERWDMSIPITEYTDTEKRARTLKSLHECAQLPKSRPAKERKGVQNLPILDIEPDHVVPDELHLLLRIGDVLMRNLIYELVQRDRRARQQNQRLVRTHLEELEQAVRECGVTFRVWEERDMAGKPSGKYEWTSLMGSDMKKVIKHLPPQFAVLLPSGSCAAVLSQLWMDFYELYEFISSYNPPDYKEIHIKAKQWVDLFLSLQSTCEGFQRKHITPYMHCLVYHVPHTIRKYGNLKQFSGQGVEKNNDVAKRNYFSSNLHDPAGEILKAEGRLETTSTYQRQKRKYSKRDEDYWRNGGLEESRKQRRLD